MMCLINITDNKLAGWIFGKDTDQLILKTKDLLKMENSPEKQSELRELLYKLSHVSYAITGKVRITDHYYLINDVAGPASL